MLLFALLFPLLLMLAAVAMEHVERPLVEESIGDRLSEFLDTARPDEVETFVIEGTAPALERYWRRRGRRLVPRRA